MSSVGVEVGTQVTLEGCVFMEGRKLGLCGGKIEEDGSEWEWSESFLDSPCLNMHCQLSDTSGQSVLRLGGS